MKVEVVKYRSEWSREFEAEAERIKEILGDEAIEIYHIGSTSVEGLSAKPIIDIMPVVKDISRIDKLNPAFEALGYECMGEFGIPGRRYFRKGGEKRTHQIHVFGLRKRIRYFPTSRRTGLSSSPCGQSGRIRTSERGIGGKISFRYRRILRRKGLFRKEYGAGSTERVLCARLPFAR